MEGDAPLNQPRRTSTRPPKPPRLVIPRPEGRRCLLVAAHGSTAVRTRTGSLLGRAQTRLPGGSRETAGEFSVVDAVMVEGEQLPGAEGQAGAGWGHDQNQNHQQQQGQQEGHGDHQQQQKQQQQQQQHSSSGGGGGGGGLPPGCVFFVSDVIAWRGVMLAGCTAECRAFWLAGNMVDCVEPAAAAAAPGSAAVAAEDGSSGGAGPRLALLPALPATAEGLEAAAVGASSGRALGFVQDGAWLLHKEGHYQPGRTPLALLWKDETCSRYLLVR
jgi:hypothetical protein